MKNTTEQIGHVSQVEPSMSVIKGWSHFPQFSVKSLIVPDHVTNRGHDWSQKLLGYECIGQSDPIQKTTAVASMLKDTTCAMSNNMAAKFLIRIIAEI